jgi:Holliday junction resolvase-like predicted endonuclease
MATVDAKTAETVVARRYLAAGYDVLCIKNASDHGIDLCATGLAAYGVRDIVFVEVKAGRARASKYQRLGGEDFVRERLMAVLYTDETGRPLPEWNAENDRSSRSWADGTVPALRG